MNSNLHRFFRLFLTCWTLTVPLYATATSEISVLDKALRDETLNPEGASNEEGVNNEVLVNKVPSSQGLNNAPFNSELSSSNVPAVSDNAPSDNAPSIDQTPVVGEKKPVYEYKGRITCEKLKHSKVYTNDARFVPFCSDALKGCFVQEQLSKLPDAHPLRQELNGRLNDHLTFNMGFCEVALLTYAPKLYHDEFKR